LVQAWFGFACVLMRFYYDTKAGTKVPAPGDGLDRLFRSSLFRGLASFALRLFRRQDRIRHAENFFPGNSVAACDQHLTVEAGHGEVADVF
jgi:hypothetical protein